MCPKYLNTQWSTLLSNSLSVPAPRRTSSFLTLSIRVTPSKLLTNTSSEEHSLSFSQHFSYPMPPLRRTLLVQLQTLRIFLQSSIRNTFQRSLRSIPLIYHVYETQWHLRFAASCDPRYWKIIHILNGSSFSLACIRPLFAYLEHLTFLLHAFTLIFLPHTPPNSLTSLHNFSRSNMLHLQITAGLSQTYHRCTKLTLKHFEIFSGNSASCLRVGFLYLYGMELAFFPFAEWAYFVRASPV